MTEGGDGLLDASGRLRRPLVGVMALATGLAVANNYYAQPLLADIGRSLHMGAGEAGLIVTMAQVGYAAGLLLLLPLGDLFERRRLTVVLCLGTALSLLAIAGAPTGGTLLAAAAAVGVCSVLAQVLVPFAASVAPAAERGRVVGMVMSGLLVGILLARTVSGALAGAGGFRVVYVAAAGAMFVLAAVLRLALPSYRQAPAQPDGAGYVALLASVVRLLREEPVLRRRSQYGLMSFGSFSVLWTSMAFLLAHHYHYSTPVIGLFGLVGAGGALAATAAGRFSDRGWARRATLGASLLLIGAWALLWWGGGALVPFVAGVLVLDVGAQGLHITNQGEIYKLRPEARSRLTSAYMVLYFVGGAAGSAASAFLYDHMGWDGVCLVGGAFALGTLALWSATELRARAP